MAELCPMDFTVHCLLLAFTQPSNRTEQTGSYHTSTRTKYFLLLATFQIVPLTYLLLPPLLGPVPTSFSYLTVRANDNTVYAKLRIPTGKAHIKVSNTFLTIPCHVQLLKLQLVPSSSAHCLPRIKPSVHRTVISMCAQWPTSYIGTTT